MLVHIMKSANTLLAGQSNLSKNEIGFSSKNAYAANLSQDSISISPKSIKQISFTSEFSDPSEAAKPLYKATIEDGEGNPVPVKITELNPKNKSVDIFLKNFLGDERYQDNYGEEEKAYYLAIQLDNKEKEPKDRVLYVAQVVKTPQPEEDGGTYLSTKYFTLNKNNHKIQNYDKAPECLMAGICQLAKESGITRITSYSMNAKDRLSYEKMELRLQDSELFLENKEINDLLKESKNYQFKPDTEPLSPSLKEFTLTGKYAAATETGLGSKLLEGICKMFGH